MAGTLETRDVVLKPLSESGPGGGGGEMRVGGGDCCPHPDPSKAAMGVTMHRAVSEKRLYLQLSSYYRELYVAGAVKRAVAQLRASDPRNAPRYESAMKEPLDGPACVPLHPSFLVCYYIDVNR